MYSSLEIKLIIRGIATVCRLSVCIFVCAFATLVECDYIH